MKIIASTHSSFPRIGESADEQKLRRAFAGLEEGKITQSDFEAVQNQVVDEAISIQERAGIDIVTDGMIRWYDPASHIARNLGGFEINGLLRFFDTNFYYRQPVAQNNISSGNGALAGEIKYARGKSGRSLKAVLMGPFTLASMSLNKTSMKFEEFCLSVADSLADQVSKLASAGADIIQIEEPAIVRNPGQFDIFKVGFQKLAARKQNAKLLLAIYFGDSGKIIDRLNDIPADMIGIDFTYSPGLLKKVGSDGFPKPLSFGILDARNTRLESPDEIASKLEHAINKLGSMENQVTTSCGLEFLPKKYAIRKLELTAQVAKLING